MATSPMRRRRRCDSADELVPARECSDRIASRPGVKSPRLSSWLRSRFGSRLGSQSCSRPSAQRARGEPEHGSWTGSGTPPRRTPSAVSLTSSLRSSYSDDGETDTDTDTDTETNDSHSADQSAGPFESRYNKIEIIGSSHFAKVYRGIDTFDDGAVAIKCAVKSTDKATAEFLERSVLLEIQVYEHLNVKGAHHNHVLMLLCADDVTGVPTLILEFSATGDLFDWFDERRPLKHAVSSDLALQIAKALTYMHGKQVAHRDVKLENVLVFPLGASDTGGASGITIKVCDFGLSFLVEGDVTLRGCQTTAMVGTPDYAAPEIMLASIESVNPFWCDRWAYGITVFSLVHGEQCYNVRGLKFGAHGNVTCLEDFGRHMSSVDEAVPRGLASVIEGSLALAPEKRISSRRACAVLSRKL